MLNKQKYVRKPLFVEAVRVTSANFEEVSAWCQGEIEQDEVKQGHTAKKYIKVRVHNPKNPRQTKAFVGDWLLYTERGYKVYTNKAFHASFNQVVVEDSEDSVSPVAEEPNKATDVQPLTSQTLEDKPDLETEIHQALPTMASLTEARDSMAMAAAKAAIEADGGTVEEATPEGIAQAVQENDEAQNGHYPETHTIGGTPREEINVGAPVSESEGKRVLSVEEQERMSQDEIRTLIQSGEVVLAQDLVA